MSKQRGINIVVVGENNIHTQAELSQTVIEHKVKEVEQLRLTISNDNLLPKEYLTGQEKRRLRRKNK